MPVPSYASMAFCSCDLDLDLVTVIYDLDQYILKVYPNTKKD